MKIGIFYRSLRKHAGDMKDTNEYSSELRRDFISRYYRIDKVVPAISMLALPLFCAAGTMGRQIENDKIFIGGLIFTTVSILTGLIYNEFLSYGILPYSNFRFRKVKKEAKIMRSMNNRNRHHNLEATTISY